MTAKPTFGRKLLCGRVEEKDLGFQVESARLILLARKQGEVHAVKLAEDVLCGWQVPTQESSQDLRPRLMKSVTEYFIRTLSLLIVWLGLQVST